MTNNGNSKSKRGPVVFPGKTVPAGDKHEESGAGHKPKLVAPPDGGWDASYVPGFSDMRHMNDALKAKGKHGVDLPANVCWVPRNYRGFMPYKRKGYEVITDAQLDESGNKRSEMLEKHGWEVAPAADVREDGTIQKDDLVLAYVPGDRYREEERKEAEYRAYMEGSTGKNVEVTTEHSEKIQISSDEEIF